MDHHFSAPEFHAFELSGWLTKADGVTGVDFALSMIDIACTAALIAHQTEAVRKNLQTALGRLVEPYREGDGLALPMVAKAAYATKAAPSAG